MALCSGIRAQMGWSHLRPNTGEFRNYVANAPDVSQPPHLCACTRAIAATKPAESSIALGWVRTHVSKTALASGTPIDQLV